MLWPLLFFLYINDIDDNITSALLKFANDTKVFRDVATSNDINMLKSDLANLFRWSEEWLMLFNIENCKMMHFGHNNVNEVYELGSKVLEVVTEELDLGVIV